MTGSSRGEVVNVIKTHVPNAVITTHATSVTSVQTGSAAGRDEPASGPEDITSEEDVSKDEDVTSGEDVSKDEEDGFSDVASGEDVSKDEDVEADILTLNP
ncbi:hypothetical protein T484DRAFT_1770752 [Baffinella frigidus]|nr:hypothetical protein T484DRAFT_1770752 [Cryptophyta sp. CCMP2293]